MNHSYPITRYFQDKELALEDTLSIEEPLEIRLKSDSASHTLSITMRTPGQDNELAAGFLFTEGILESAGQLSSLPKSTALTPNVVTLTTIPGFEPQTGKADRNFYTTSSCGVCGKTSLEAVRVVQTGPSAIPEALQFSREILFGLPKKLRQAQDEFGQTGGIHASGFFTLEGQLECLREDVGRHNALDKLVGRYFLENALPLDNGILLLSGRASFELIQKAVRAGIRVVAAIGAPSSLAVDLAKEFDLSLIGFLREDRFNCYHLSTHVQIL